MYDTVNDWLLEYLSRGAGVRPNIVQASHYLRGLSL